MVKHPGLILFLCLFSLGVWGQTAPKYSNEFLSIGVGARSLGMSGAVVASTQDASSNYWNPAGLALMENDMQVGLMHNEYFAGIAKYDYGAVAYRPNNNAVIGASLIRFGVDDIPNTLDLIDDDGNIRYDRLSAFSAADYAFLLSYGRKTPIDNLFLGGNVKIVHRQAGSFAHAWGFGIDLAARYDLDKWQFGANLRDITSTFNAWRFNQDLLEESFTATGNIVPENSVELTLPSLIVGGARIFDIGKSFTALAELDMLCTFDGKRNVLLKSDFLSVDPKIGAEFGYKGIVFLRAGAGNFQQIPQTDGGDAFNLQPNIGLGIHLRGLSIDYALTDLGDVSVAMYSHVFSVKYRFDVTTTAEKQTPMQQNQEQ